MSLASEGDYMYHHRQLKIGTGGLATGCEVTVIYKFKYLSHS